MPHLGRLGAARAIIRQMPADHTFLASELNQRVQGGSWGKLEAMQLVECVGMKGPKKIWRLTLGSRRAKREVPIL
jgi:hypothetical protein